MDVIPQLPVSQAEQIREANRRSAVFSGGHKFIWLTLINPKLMRIIGIEYIHALPYIDEMNGNITRYHLEIRGGVTDFQFDPSKGLFRYAMLDSEHNRKFLASHYHLNIWTIEDDAIREQIEKMSNAISDEIKNPQYLKKENPQKENIENEKKEIKPTKKYKSKKKNKTIKFNKVAEESKTEIKQEAIGDNLESFIPDFNAPDDSIASRQTMVKP